MVYLILAAYNEAAVIHDLLVAVAAAMRSTPISYRVVLVDDGSKDDTVAEAERAVSESRGTLPLTVVRHPINRGLGAGLRTGFETVLATANDDDVITMMDADLTHPPALMIPLLDRLDQGYDVVIASRYRPGAEVIGVPRSRRLLSDGGRWVLQALFPIAGVRDYTCCFRAYRVSIIRRARRAYGEQLFTATGFEAVMDLLLKLRPLGIRASEIPLQLDYRSRSGQSKMAVLRTIRSTLLLLARRRIDQFTRSTPARLARLESTATPPST